MSEITNPKELEFLQAQWKNKTVNKAKANKSDVPVTDPVELSILRDSPTAKEDWLEDVIMGSRALLDGYFWGWSDEVAASISAGLYQAFLQPEESNVQLPQALQNREGTVTAKPSYNDVRREMLGQLESERAAWTEDNSGLGLTLNLIGGFGSGSQVYSAVKTGITATAKAAGAAAMSIPRVQQGVQGLQQARVQSALGRAATTPAPATAFEASIARDIGGKNLLGFGSTLLPKVASELPALAATGAIAAAGFAPQGEDLTEAATTGAGVSMLIGAPATALISYVANGATTNRIAQELGKGRDFIPIGMAALKNSVDKVEKSLEYGYNKIVRHAFGADSLIAQQQKRWTTLADQELANAEKTIASAIKDADSRLAATTKQAEAVRLRETEAALEAQNLTAAERKIASNEIADNLKLNAVADADAATNAAEAALRVEAHKNSIPRGATKEEIDLIFSLPNLHERQKSINALWNKYGFEMLKGKEFTVNPQEVAVKLRTALGDEAELLAGLSGSKPVNAAGVIEEYIQSYVKNGNVINGDTLNKLRTTVAQMANKLGTEGADASNRIVLKKLVSILDDITFPQLSASEQAAFLAQKEQWGQNIIVRDAITKATKKNGSFTPEDYLGSVLSNNKKAAQEGTGFLQKEANTIIRQTEQSNKAIQKLATEQVTKQSREAARAAAAALSQSQKRIENLKAQANSKILNAENKAEALKKLEVENIRLNSLKETVKGYQQIAAKTDASPFFKLFANALLGFGNPIRGIAVGATISTQGVQRLLVGQQQWQKTLNAVLQKSDQPISKGVQTLIRGEMSTGQRDTSMDAPALNTLNSATLKQQLQAYDKLEKAGKLDELRVRNPRVYETLIRANKSR